MARRNSHRMERVLLLAVISASIPLCSSAQARDIFVAKSGSDTNTGNIGHPVLTIQHAADIAYPGDTITVHSGIYRERVDPPRGGTSENERIVYRAAPGEDVRIVGSEHVADWVGGGSSWKVVLPAGYFGLFNRFAKLVRNPHFVGGDNNDGWGSEPFPTNVSPPLTGFATLPIFHCGTNCHVLRIMSIHCRATGQTRKVS